MIAVEIIKRDCLFAVEEQTRTQIDRDACQLERKLYGDGGKVLVWSQRLIPPRETERVSNSRRSFKYHPPSLHPVMFTDP